MLETERPNPVTWKNQNLNRPTKTHDCSEWLIPYISDDESSENSICNSYEDMDVDLKGKRTLLEDSSSDHVGDEKSKRARIFDDESLSALIEKNKYRDFLAKSLLHYKEQVDRYDFTNKTNQELGAQYYEIFCCVRLELIRHEDLPEWFLGIFLKKSGMQKFSEHVDPINKKYTRDIGGDAYNLFKKIIFQMKFFNGTQITYDMLSHTQAVMELYGLERCKLITTSHANYHHLTNLLLNLPFWSKEIIDVGEDVQAIANQNLKRNSNKVPPTTDAAEFEPRRWQRDALGVILKNDETYMQAPPGCGKTDLFPLYVRNHQDGRHLFIVPRQDLAAQTKSRIEARLPDRLNKVIVLGNGYTPSKDFPANSIIVAVDMSLKHLPDSLHFESIWIDEYHLHGDLIEKYVSGFTWNKLVKMSATMPEDVKLDYHYALGAAINDGYVEDYVFTVVGFTKGNHLQAACEYVCERPKIWPIQLFFNTIDRVKEAKKYIDALPCQSRGITPNVQIITSKTKREDRDDAKNRLEEGKIDILIVCQCFAVGTDLPSLRSTFIVDKKTKAATLIQAMLRCLRVHRAKPRANILVAYQSNQDSSDDGIEENKDLGRIIGNLRNYDQRLQDKNKLRLQTRMDCHRTSSSDSCAQSEHDDELPIATFTFEKMIDVITTDQEKKMDSLVKYFETNEDAPSQSKKAKEEYIKKYDFDLAIFWNNCTSGWNAELFAKALDKSPNMRAAKNKFDANKTAREKLEKKTPQEKVDIIVKYFETTTDPPSQSKKEEYIKKYGFDLSIFWTNILSHGRHANLFAKALDKSLNMQAAKNKFDANKTARDKACKKTPQEKVGSFVKYFETTTDPPSQSKKEEYIQKYGFDLGQFWSDCTSRGRHANLFAEALDNSPNMQAAKNKSDANRTAKREKKSKNKN